MRRINLLPSDERGRPADRLRRGVLGILLIVSAFVVILMVGIYLVLLLRLNDLEEQVANLDDDIAQQNAQLAELSPYRDLKTRLEDKKPVALDAPVEQPLDPPGTITFTGVALPRFENVADFVVRMDNLQYLANADLEIAEREGSSKDSPVSFEVASELVTVVGENGTEVRLEGGSQDEVADRGGSLSTREVANTEGFYGAAGEQYARRTGGGGR